LKASVNWRCASLNSGVEKERRGSSFLRISSSCTVGWLKGLKDVSGAGGRERGEG
jgi:hypothetical protein